MADIDIKTLPVLTGAIGTPVYGLVDTPGGLKLVELGEFAAVDMPLENATYAAGDASLMRRGDQLVSVPYARGEPLIEQVTTSSTTRALVAGDDRKSIRMSGASAVLTVPIDAPFAAGFCCGGSMTAGGTITAAAGVTLNGVDGGSIEIGSEALGQRWRLERVGLNAWLVSGLSPIVTGAQFVAILTAVASDLTLGPALGAALATALASLDIDTRDALLVALTQGIIGDGEAVMRRDDGSGVEGLVLTAGVEATQRDVLEGTDTEKTVTAEAAGGFERLRTIDYDATLTIDFTADSPVWGAENVVADVSGAAALQAEGFPGYMVGREFSVRFVRASGTGNVTVQDNESGANVEYRGGLSATDMPALGTTAGDSVTVRGKVMGEALWRVEAFEWKAA